MHQEQVRSKCILVVEDDPDFAELIDSVLSPQGYTVVTTPTAKNALEIIKAIPPDLITLDMQLPGRSGAHLYRELMNDPAFCDIPTIVITGLTAIDRDWDGFIRSFLEVGHTQAPKAYLEKPFENQELIDAVEGVFSKGGSTFEYRQPPCRSTSNCAAQERLKTTS